MQAIPILVTAVGSELAFSILKACRLSSLPLSIIGCDMAAPVAGIQWCDRFVQVPSAKNNPEHYLESLRALVREYGIRGILPSTDGEALLLANHQAMFQGAPTCHTLVNPPEVLKLFNDKWLAACFYARQNIPSPQTFLAEHAEQRQEAIRALGFPLILKPRFGGGSRFLFKIDSEDMLERLWGVVPQPIVQAWLDEDGGEWTAGTFRSASGEIHVVLLRRTLKFGMTNTAQVVVDRPDLEDFCRQVIHATPLIGSNNVQFRVAAQRAQVLEINPRFSGTAGIRARAGFNDVEMWLKDSLGLGPVTPPIVRPLTVVRYMEELEIKEWPI